MEALKRNIFISYSHTDMAWLEKVQKFIKTLPSQFQAEAWSDQEIPVGGDWREEIQNAMESAQIAILLISVDFLASGFIRDMEIPFLLKQVKAGLLKIFPIYIHPCPWRIHDWLEAKQMLMLDKEKEKALSEGADNEVNTVLSQFISELYANMSQLPAPRVRASAVQAVVSSVSSAPDENAWIQAVATPGELKPKEIMGAMRAKKYKPFYWGRETDKTLLALLKNNQDVLVRGNPLAGKSRALFEALKQLQDVFIIVPRDNPPGESDWKLPDNPYRKVLVLDDLDGYLARYGKEKLEQMLDAMAKQEATVAATIRWGDEFVDISHQLNREIMAVFTKVDIPRLEGQSRQAFEQTLKKTSNTDNTDNSHGLQNTLEMDWKGFDGNVGSCFMDLARMKTRWEELAANTRKHIPGVQPGLPTRILEGLKYFYYTENMRGKNAVDKVKLYDFCRKSVKVGKEEKRQRPGGTGFGRLEQQLAERETQSGPVLTAFTPREFEEALEWLGSGENKLNFLDSGWEEIVTEEVYLERVVKPGMGLMRILEELGQVYKGADLQELGFLVNIYDFSRFIHRASTLEEAEKTLEKLATLGVRGDVVTYSTCMAKAKTLKEARRLLGAMQKAGIPADVITYNTLMKKAPDYREARGVLAEMQQAGIFPDVIFWSALLDKAPDYAAARETLAEMQKAGILPDVVTFTSLINQSADFEEARRIPEDMKAFGVLPDVVTFNTLMKKAPDYESALPLLEQMREAKIKPDVFTFTTLMNKTRHLNAALGVLDAMRQEGIRPNEVTERTLMKKASTRDEKEIAQAALRKFRN